MKESVQLQAAVVLSTETVPILIDSMGLRTVWTLWREEKL
jgi:hypothetical protein